jgi:hypothetical protein
MQFRNPENGYVETKSVPWLWAFLFGGFYFIVSGIWAPSIIWLFLAALLYAVMGPPATILMLFVGFVFAGFAPGLVKNSYLRKGWAEIVEGSASPRFASAMGVPAGSMAATHKKCPFCAEEIKVEAKLCRFCNREITQNKDQENAEAKLERDTNTAIAELCSLGFTVKVLSDGGWKVSKASQNVLEYPESLAELQFVLEREKGGARA